MKHVIRIGPFVDTGGFAPRPWGAFLALIRSEVDTIRFLTRLTRSEIAQMLCDTEVFEEASIDMESGFKTMRVSELGAGFWDSLTCGAFEPTSGIAHVLFYKDEQCVASVESDDEETFAVIDILASERLNAAGFKPASPAIIRLWCDRIDELTEGHPWRLWEHA